MIRFWTPAACRGARALMLDGVEGRLVQRERLGVQDHLARCGSCAEELADLVAAHHAARRALEPLRRARTNVAPGRARLRAYSGDRSAPRAFEMFARLGRRAERSLVFAVLALAFLGSLPSAGAQQRSEPRGAGSTSGYLRAADDPGGLLGPRLLRSERIPVGDGLLIELVAPSDDRSIGERPRQGLQQPTPY